MHIEQRLKALERKRRSDLGIPSDRTLRRKVIERFMDRGDHNDLSQFLELHHGWKVSPDAVRMVVARLKKVRRWVQLALWPDNLFKVPAPPMRCVHHARRTKPDGFQLSLDLFNVGISIAA